MPKVSVIMPVYNGARFVRLAVESVLAQTSTDWELIVVDDGSTDETAAILACYDDSRITKIRQENAGEATARNSALAHATGTYVSFLDADDIYLPDALKELSDYLDNHREYDAVYSNGYLCDEHEGVLSELSDFRQNIFTGRILEPLILDPAVIGVPSCTMTSREIIHRTGGTFDQAMVIGPDWDFWIQLASRGGRFGYLDRHTCKYRVHQTNITRMSGRRRRTQDLVHNRLKVLTAQWFPDLTVRTRCAFFYSLLVVLLRGQPGEQVKILDHPRFRALPVKEQATLWRHVGMDHLCAASGGDFGRSCLSKAAQLSPSDPKNWCAVHAMNLLGRRGVVLLSNGWRRIQSARSILRQGREKPRTQAPPGLAPIGD